MAAPVPRSRIKLSSAQATVREQICGGLLLHIGCGQRVAATGTFRAAETAENGRHALGISILIGQVHVATGHTVGPLSYCLCSMMWL